jgi:hypothetical protein
VGQISGNVPRQLISAPDDSVRGHGHYERDEGSFGSAGHVKKQSLEKCEEVKVGSRDVDRRERDARFDRSGSRPSDAPAQEPQQCLCRPVGLQRLEVFDDRSPLGFHQTISEEVTAVSVARERCVVDPGPRVPVAHLRFAVP